MDRVYNVVSFWVVINLLDIDGMIKEDRIDV